MNRNYVIAYHRCEQTLMYFRPYLGSTSAIQDRHWLERKLWQSDAFGPTCLEVVVIGAPDLATLISSYHRYFDNMPLPATSIAECFFCRSFLNGEEIDIIETAELVAAARDHGHCVACHQIYHLGQEREHVCSMIGTVVDPGEATP